MLEMEIIDGCLTMVCKLLDNIGSLPSLVVTKLKEKFEKEVAAIPIVLPNIASCEISAVIKI